MARVLLSAPDARHWSYGVAVAAGLTPPQVVNVLKSMREDGWLVAKWEDPEQVAGRSPRRYYTLTDLGRVHLAELAR